MNEGKAKPRGLTMFGRIAISRVGCVSLIVNFRDGVNGPEFYSDIDTAGSVWCGDGSLRMLHGYATVSAMHGVVPKPASAHSVGEQLFAGRGMMPSASQGIQIHSGGNRNPARAPRFVWRTGVHRAGRLRAV